MSSVPGNRHQAAANRAKAPVTGAFVDAMRNQFGAVKIEYVSENGLVLGKVPEYGGTWVSGADMRLWDAKAKRYI